jgi:hypothetical protein
VTHHRHARRERHGGGIRRQIDAADLGGTFGVRRVENPEVADAVGGVGDDGDVADSSDREGVDRRPVRRSVWLAG